MESFLLKHRGISFILHGLQFNLVRGHKMRKTKLVKEMERDNRKHFSKSYFFDIITTNIDNKVLL